MTTIRLITYAALALIGIALVAPRCCLCAEAQGKALIDVSATGSESRLEPSGAQVTVTHGTDATTPGPVVTIAAGDAKYPGVTIKPDAGAAVWDLSAYGHIDAQVTNTGTGRIRVALRVDNAGDWRDGPWSVGKEWIAPGQSRKITVIFGYSWGKATYPLKPNAITQVMIFTEKADSPSSFRLDSLVAAGPSGEVPPESIRVKPVGGAILGPGTAIDPVTQITQQSAQASPASDNAGLSVDFLAGSGDRWIRLKPANGRWDMRLYDEVRVKVKNTGSGPITPSVQLNGGDGATDEVATRNALTPGQEAVIVVPFAPAVTWKGIPNSGDRTSWEGQPGTGTKFASDAVDSVKVSAAYESAAKLLVESIVADALPVAPPSWLGTRPPVAGDWVKTFDDEFNGNSVDTAKWNIYGPNYWDAKTHWTKDNLVVANGVATLHFEKKAGYQNDDPKQILDLTSPRVSQSKYACGFLESYGKWSQRYGYFEARVKLPTAPGLWPTFWLMPDRGQAAGERWQREDTANGGMEFDILEHLDRWGAYRYNIAMHWDGYGANHHQTGSTFNYVQHDKDGYMTVGMLWRPGRRSTIVTGRKCCDGRTRV